MSDKKGPLRERSSKAYGVALERDSWGQVLEATESYDK